MFVKQRVRRISEWNGESFKGATKRKKERLSFITQFKIEFLLPFTSCRKVFGKMPARGQPHSPDVNYTALFNFNPKVIMCLITRLGL